MKKELKIYHTHNGTNYSNWIPNRKIVDTVEEADLVLMIGGSDLGGEYYGEKRGSYVGVDEYADKIEKEVFDKAVKLGIKILGVCKGSQCCAGFSGGKVIQHQKNPSYIHPVKTIEGRELLFSSTHHNAQNPYNLPKDEYKVLAWTEDMCGFHLNGDDKESYNNGEKEVEICYYPKTKALGIQPHPSL